MTEVPTDVKKRDRLDSATFVLESPERTLEWGNAVGRLLVPGDVIALNGDLGAGKTTLTRGIALGMGIRDEITSPTFTLLHEYRGLLPLFHIDPYRLERPEDIYDLGFEEYLERGGVTVIEWAGLLQGLLPPERLALTIEIPNDGEYIEQEGTDLTGTSRRSIAAEASGERYERLLATIVAVWNDSGNDVMERCH